jgi:Mg2+/Co2+ transporter CorB
MNIQLSEETVLAVLTLNKFKETVMAAIDTLTTELAETKAGVAAVGAALTALLAKHAEVVAKLLASVTPEQVDAAKVEFDASQAQLADLAAQMTVIANPPAPEEPQA